MGTIAVKFSHCDDDEHWPPRQTLLYWYQSWVVKRSAKLKSCCWNACARPFAVMKLLRKEGCFGMEGILQQVPSPWHRIEISQVEDLSRRGAWCRNGSYTDGRVARCQEPHFFRAGWRDIQRRLYRRPCGASRPSLPGHSFFGAWPLVPGSSWHSFTEVKTGDVAIYHGGDEHDSLYAPGSMYAVATISPISSSKKPERNGMVLDRAALGGSGFTIDP